MDLSRVLYACSLPSSCANAVVEFVWGPQLFVDSGLEKEDLVAEEDLANQMGLFLQKNNIVRDYLEDINELPAPRCEVD